MKGKETLTFKKKSPNEKKELLDLKKKYTLYCTVRLATQ